MELKQNKGKSFDSSGILLIVPYGIETQQINHITFVNKLF